MNKTVKTMLIVSTLCVITNSAYAAPLPSMEYAPELSKVETMINWTTLLIQVLGSMVAGLRATVHFYDMILGESTDNTKKSLIRIGYGLAGLFFASQGINFLVRKFFQVAMS